MTPVAKGGQVLFGVWARLTSADLMMDLELIAPTTVLTPKTIPLQDFLL